jgi:hypothetical protein
MDLAATIACLSEEAGIHTKKGGFAPLKSQIYWLILFLIQIILRECPSLANATLHQQ